METFSNDEIQKAVESAVFDGLDLESAPTAIPIYSRFIDVAESDVDVWGHANNVCYLHWMQDVAVAHSAAVGWTPERYLDFGAIWVVRRHSIEYRRSAFRGERMIGQTWVAEMKNVSCVRRYRFLRPPKGFSLGLGSSDSAASAAELAAVAAFEFPKTSVLATAETLWGFVSTGSAPRPVRVAPDLRAAFDSAVESGVQFPEFDENRLK